MRSEEPVRFTEQDILSDLDEVGQANPYKFFLDLDHGYSYTASSRLTLFADPGRWAIVMEMTGYNPRGDGVVLEVHYFGNCLHGLDRAGSHDQFLCNTKFFNLSTGIRDKITVGIDLVSPSAAVMTVRGQELPIDHNVEHYEAIGINTHEEDNPDRLMNTWGLVRFLSEKYPDLFRANEEELRTCLPADLPKLMHIDRWVHPETWELYGGGGPKPSESGTIRMLAKILVQRDSSLWEEPASPNNDWRFHPEAGGL